MESFNTFEYRDVGLTLKITPHISKDRTVRLKIEQELTKLEDLSEGTSQTTDDDALTSSTQKIPCAGDIPGLGWLFKSQSDSKEKTNLYVFLTPHVVKNPIEAQQLYQQKREDIKETVKEGSLRGGAPTRFRRKR